MLLGHGGLPCNLENPQTYAFLGALLYYVYPILGAVRAYFSARGR
jgi:hypothetical protein